MTCKHKKPSTFGHAHKWCDPCALKAAGPKPANKFKHGDYAESRSWDDRDGPMKVLDSEMNVIGQATDSPKWSEYLIFRDGAGSADLYKKVKIVTVEDES